MIVPSGDVGYVHQGPDIEPYFDERYQCQFWPVVSLSNGTVLHALQAKQWQCYLETPLNPYMYWREIAPEWIGFGGAAGGGKSRFARAIATAFSWLYPNSNVLILRETRADVIENHLEEFQLETPADLYSLRQSPKIEIRWRHNNSRIRFGYLSQDKHLKQYQGPSFDCIIFEEATHYMWKWISYLMNSRLRTTIPGCKPFAVFPSNPGSRGHAWYKRIFVDRRFLPDEHPFKYSFVQAKLRDNAVLMTEDPAYVARLQRLAEPLRSQLADGDFSAGAGMALQELDRSVHIVPFFVPPPHWTFFGAFDWGFAHPYSFGYYAVNEDGTIFKCDTIIGRREQPPAIASRITEQLRLRGLEPDRMLYIVAGWDCFHDAKVQTRSDNTRSRADQMRDYGFTLMKANIARMQGLSNMREYVAWQHTGDPVPRDEWVDPRVPEFGPGQPAFYLMDTPGNQRCFECLEMMTEDPDNLEDVIKVDADEFGEGGDDTYDETRYGLASRPPRASAVALDRPISAFAPEILEHEARAGRIDTGERRRRKKVTLPPDLVHPEFGGQM